MIIFLEKITLRFPGEPTGFTDRLAGLIAALGKWMDRTLVLTLSDLSFYPEIYLDFSSGSSEMLADFTLSNGEVTSVLIENSTGQSKRSPHSYQLISLEAASQRLADSGIYIVGSDHVGFNLPWFAAGLHPNIIKLRENHSPHCLYHRYPTGEPWDFILPGDIDEIVQRKTIDYTEHRRPKFELVSFEKASTPLVQLDVNGLE